MNRTTTKGLPSKFPEEQTIKIYKGKKPAKVKMRQRKHVNVRWNRQAHRYEIRQMRRHTKF